MAEKGLRGLRDKLGGALDLTMVPILRTLGMDICSELGARYGVGFARLTRGFRIQEAEIQAKANWRLLRPDAASPEETEAAVRRLWREVGRTLAEFAVIDRFWPAGRITVEGAEHLATAKAEGPVVLTDLHLGNWEVVGLALKGLGYHVPIMYQAQANRFRHRIAVGARARAGVDMFPAWRGGGRRMLNALQTGDRMAGFVIDEFSRGRVQAPLFGRPGPPAGNLMHACRLAVMTGATIVPGYGVRTRRARFKVVFLPPFRMTATTTRGADFEADTRRLDALIEPIVREYLHQWYWLPHFALEDVPMETIDPMGGALDESPGDLER